MVDYPSALELGISWLTNWSLEMTLSHFFQQGPMASPSKLWQGEHR